MELQALEPVDRFDISGFEYLPEQSFEVVVFVVQGKQTNRIDGDEFCIFDGLYPFPRRPARKQAFCPGDDCIFEFKALGDIGIFLEIIDPQSALYDNIDGPAGMANGLQVGIFADSDGVGNGGEGCGGGWGEGGDGGEVVHAMSLSQRPLFIFVFRIWHFVNQSCKIYEIRNVGKSW